MFSSTSNRPYVPIMSQTSIQSDAAVMKDLVASRWSVFFGAGGFWLVLMAGLLGIASRLSLPVVGDLLQSAVELLLLGTAMSHTLASPAEVGSLLLGWLLAWRLSSGR